MICTVWSIDDSPAGRDVFYRRERDRERLTAREESMTVDLRVAIALRNEPDIDWPDFDRTERRREDVRNRIATLRAIRFVLEVLS